MGVEVVNPCEEGRTVRGHVGGLASAAGGRRQELELCDSGPQAHHAVHEGFVVSDGPRQVARLSVQDVSLSADVALEDGDVRLVGAIHGIGAEI